jgi:hypothetical protein
MEIKIDEKTALQFFYSFAFKNKKHEQFHVNFFKIYFWCFAIGYLYFCYF